MVNPGRQTVYGKDVQAAGAEGDSTLVKLNPGEVVLAEEVRVISNHTRPPARFNEATLLSAMEGAGKLVEDEELREAMSAKGLGTPATRASIIEGLVSENYMQRVGGSCIPRPRHFR